MTRITLSQALRPVCLATALALMGVAATPAWAQREVPTRTTQVQFKRGAALPPEISHMTVWSPITPVLSRVSIN